jgi:hypothetical protein
MSLWNVNGLNKPGNRSVIVCKTTVEKNLTAEAIIRDIKRIYPDYTVNFDLEDCDNILRVASGNESVDESGIRSILQNAGFRMEELPVSFPE